MLTTDTDLEWDDTGMLPPSQNSAVLDKLKGAVDGYISELQNEKLSKQTTPKHVNIDNVLPKIRNLFNDELSKDTSPKQVNIDNVLPKIRNLFNDELSKDTSPKQVNIDNVLPKIRDLFNDELSKNTTPKYTKQSTQDQPKISTGAVAGLKDRIARFEADSDSKIKKYWAEEKKQAVEKQHENTQSGYITPKKNFEFENQGKEIKENSAKKFNK